MPRIPPRFVLPLIVVLALAPAPAAARSDPTPRWLLHVQRYPGGNSATVRASAVVHPTGTTAGPGVAATGTGTGNVLMNNNSRPPLPQNETAVAVNLIDPLVAVAGANDYVNGGITLMRTLDGGRSWLTRRVTPFTGTSPPEVCRGGDPTVAYSLRDRAFYAGQLCFFRTNPISEVFVVKSVDNGRTWSPGRLAARAASNVDYSTGVVDASIFNDRETITVDNNPGSPYYGRLYVAYTKYHNRDDGFSDYCPMQLSWTDKIPTGDPSTAAFGHSKVVPDAPGGDGTGPSSTQLGYPQVQRDGTVDVLYGQENCNDGLDAGVNLQKSRDGGRTWLPAPVHVTTPGQFLDNPDPEDLLPPTAFRAPLSPSFTYNPKTGTLATVYQNNLRRSTSGADVSLQLSRDGGRTWSDARTLSVDANGRPARGDQFFGAITAAPDGVFTAIWYDRRRDPANHDIDTWQAWSVDDGRTWTQRRISSTSWNPDNGFFTDGSFIGDYLGVAASTRAFYPVWADGRLSPRNRDPGAVGSTEIFTDVQPR